MESAAPPEQTAYDYPAPFPLAGEAHDGLKLHDYLIRSVTNFFSSIVLFTGVAAMPEFNNW